LKKFTIKDLFKKGAKLRGLILIEDKGEIKKIKSLMANRGSICINQRQRITMKKTLKFKVILKFKEGKIA
jgi:hypothetical protein